MAQVAAIAGAVLGAAQSVFGGIEQNSAARRAARAEDENARLTTYQGALDATQGLRSDRQQIGADLAGGAEGGAALGGSISDIIAANSVESQMRALNARYQAANEAAQHRQRADDLRKQGKAALIQGIIGGATALVGGAVQSRNQTRSDILAEKSRSAGLGGSGGTLSSVKPFAGSGNTASAFGGY